MVWILLSWISDASISLFQKLLCCSLLQGTSINICWGFTDPTSQTQVLRISHANKLAIPSFLRRLQTFLKRTSNFIFNYGCLMPYRPKWIVRGSLGWVFCNFCLCSESFCCGCFYCLRRVGAFGTFSVRRALPPKHVCCPARTQLFDVESKANPGEHRPLASFSPLKQ